MSSPNAASEELASALSDGACLLDSAKSTTPATDLKTVLESRLSTYFSRQHVDGAISGKSLTLEEVQMITATQALSVVERVQKVLGTEEAVEKSGAHSDVPAIGTRDLAELRTLLALVFKWAVEPLLSSVIEAWPVKLPPTSTREPRIIDLTAAPENYKCLSALVTRLFSLLFPTGIHSALPQTLVTTTILNRHVTDILRPAIPLGWLPKSLLSESMPTMDEIRPFTMRLLSILPPSQTIASLGIILSADPSPLHVHKTCTSLLSRQLLRPEGVRGLCEAVFGQEESSGSEIPITKLQHVARVLTTVPAGMKPQEYFQTIIPRIIAMLSDKYPEAYRRAAAFAVSRTLAPGQAFPHQEVASDAVFTVLHQPFLRIIRDSSNLAEMDASFGFPSPILLAPSVALSNVITLISNTDPSPVFISRLLSPIVPALYSLLYYLDKNKTSDPTLKESLHGILITWGKIIETSEGIEILWSILYHSAGGKWKAGLGEDFHRIEEPEQEAPLLLLTPEDLKKREEIDEPDFDTNLFDLYPDPSHFVQFLKSIDRGDISSAIFVKLLEVYRTMKSQAEDDSMQLLLFLQVIMQMQKYLSEGTASNILRNPAHILSFIKHVLESANIAPEYKRRYPSENLHLKIHDLRMAPEASLDDMSDEADSDDDMPDSETIRPDDEMIETAVNLILSILEADENLSARTQPILNDIFSFLEPLSREGSASIRPLAREARMVITARLASTSRESRKMSKTSEEEDAQEIYQKALKLLQDPILPVRAHGLLLLRQLVTPPSKRDAKDPKLVDPALIPAILSIFLQSVQDDDSYIFLNAVQGLAAMVDRFGKDVLKGLVQQYGGGLDGLGATTLNQQDIDVRTRVGEALSTVIKRCGDALGIYVDILVPPLFSIVRYRHVATTLRTSSLSLLADCVNTSFVAVFPYVEDLAETMIDLLQIEGVPTNQKDPVPPTPNTKESEEAIPVPTMDSDPTSTNSKFPPFRRAALHFLSLLIQETTKQIYFSTPGVSMSLLSNSLLKKASITLGYMATTDEDNVTRVMAREAKEGLNELQSAKWGL